MSKVQNEYRPAATSAKLAATIAKRARRANRVKRSIIASWILRARLVPKRVDFNGLSGDHSISNAQPMHHSGVAAFIPRPNRHFAPDDDFARRQDERVIAVGIEDQRPLIDHKRIAGLRYDSNAREHLR